MARLNHEINKVLVMRAKKKKKAWHWFAGLPFGICNLSKICSKVELHFFYCVLTVYPKELCFQI